MSAGNWIGVIGIVIGVIATLWSYHRTRDHRIVRYAQVRRDMISEEAFSTPPGRLISVDGDPIRRLYREYILIHSAGNKSIRFAEELNAITLNLPADARVLAAGVYRNDDPANAAAVAFKANEANLSFDYLRSNDAIVFFIDHEVEDESSTQVSVHERERDAVKRGSHITMQLLGDRQALGFTSSLLFIFIFLLLLPFTDIVYLFTDPTRPMRFVEGVFFILVFLLVPILGFIIGFYLHRLLRHQTPAMKAYIVQVSRASAAINSQRWLVNEQ